MPGLFGSRLRSIFSSTWNICHRPTSAVKMSNRLKDEKSPYLLQHQHNPVDWHPWNPETLALAKSLGKPIFLSSGYSTCHWCHVMERESFENPAIAAIMNDKFINIKLDREEHPDIDRIYMSFIQAISGSGGWPMSVWMTPDLKPFYGGTYFPPEERYYGRPGFKTLLLSLAEQWEENPDKCMESSTRVVDVMVRSAVFPTNETLPKESGKKCLGQLTRSFEPAFGGFSQQPKFPQPVNLQFLIHHSKTEKDCFKMVDKTLRMMRKGGIYDHLGKGFSRYSTDKKWHVPHFEKMLYDQAQLATAYLNAYLVSKDEDFAHVVHEILEYVSRDLSVEDGGFYSAEDADSLATAGAHEKKEGAFYVWEKHEIDEILKDSKLSNGKCVAELFCKRYGVKADGNVDPYQDPHDELKKKNVLFEAKTYQELASEFSIAAEEVESSLNSAKEKLFHWRNANRPRPHLDNKFIASWNGLMTQAYAQAGYALSNKAYVDRAVKAAELIETNFFVNGDLLRTCYISASGSVVNLEIPIKACVDDFANVIGAMLDVFQATGNAKYLKLAVKLQSKQDELFWDGANGGYFNSRGDDSSVIVRMKDDDDGAEPSSNSTSLVNLFRLNCIYPGEYLPKAQKVLYQFCDRLEKLPITLPLMTATLETYRNKPKSAIVVGKKLQNSEIFLNLKKQLIPLGGIVVPVDLDSDLEELKKTAPILEEKTRISSDDVVVYIREGQNETVVKTLEAVSKVFA